VVSANVSRRSRSMKRRILHDAPAMGTRLGSKEVLGIVGSRADFGGAGRRGFGGRGLGLAFLPLERFVVPIYSLHCTPPGHALQCPATNAAAPCRGCFSERQSQPVRSATALWTTALVRPMDSLQPQAHCFGAVGPTSRRWRSSLRGNLMPVRQAILASGGHPSPREASRASCSCDVDASPLS
jgi:hypothetical protein